MPVTVPELSVMVSTFFDIDMQVPFFVDERSRSMRPLCVDQLQDDDLSATQGNDIALVSGDGANLGELFCAVLSHLRPVTIET
jgi:hypothetical protein